MLISVLWFSTHSDRWFSPLVSWKNPFFWAALGFCDKEKQRSGFGLQNGLFKPVSESQSFSLQKLGFWEQKMLRIKKQSRKGTGHKEYPQMVMQKPFEAISTCADLVGRSRGSRRDFPRSLYQHCPSPTLRATWELSQHWPASRSIRCVAGHHLDLHWGAQLAGPVAFWTGPPKMLIDCLPQLVLICVLNAAPLNYPTGSNCFQRPREFSFPWDKAWTMP